jgi:alanine racemase
MHHEAVWNHPGRGARLIVDLAAIESNTRAVSQAVTPGTQVLAVVKAAAYGHGAPAAARAALAGGASWLGVATVVEGLELRRAGIGTPVLVMSPTVAGEWEPAAMAALDITVGSREQLEALISWAEGRPRAERVAIHLKVNTGMNRFGVEPGQAVTAATRLSRARGLRLRGISTHFARSDEADALPTLRQLERFHEVLRQLEAAGIAPPIAHASNSGATLRFRECDLDMVRPGICLYGVRPSTHAPLLDEMRPAMRLEAMVQRVEQMAAGEQVGYGGTFAAPEAVRIGLLPFGYADGYPRAMSNLAWVAKAGVRMPVAGRVSMDQTVVQIPDGARVEPGSIVRALGDGSAGEPTVEELAEMAGTIPYEIMTGLSRRLPAHYIRGDNVVEHDNLV